MHKATCLHMQVATTGAKEAVSILQEIKMKSIYITRQTLKSNLKVSDELCRRHKVGRHFFRYLVWFQSVCWDIANFIGKKIYCLH